MTLARLVRHGRAAAGWDTHVDPPLDDVGRQQAAELAEVLAPLGPLPIVTSPLQRCRDTADVLASRWGVAPRVEPAVSEVPSPDGIAMADRVDWLRDAMRGTWSALGPRYTAYRDSVVAAVAGIDTDTVITSHFVAINAVIGAIVGDDRVLLRSLDNCSVTIVEVLADGTMRLVEGGHEADTLIR